MSLYKTKFVAFVDLLGFSNTIERSSNDAELQRRVADVVSTFQDTGCENEHHDIKLTGFSDSLIISAAVSPEGFDGLLMMISQIGRNLLQRDILIRGGIALGEIHHAGSHTFGPALNAAYSIENEWAVYPCVIVSSEVVAAATSFAGTARLCPDPHRPHLTMLDYLKPLRHYTSEPIQGGVVWDGPARIMAKHIQNRLMAHRSNAGLLAKAKWIEAYWNSAVAENGILPTTADEIDLTRSYPSEERSMMVEIAGQKVSLSVEGQSLDPDR